MRITPLALVLATAALSTACASAPSETTSASRSAATAFANDEPAYDFFVSKGLTNFQAAGIVGNLDQESGVDPAAAQSGGPGRGIAQWSVGGRWDTDKDDNLVAYAAQQNEPTSSLTVQLDFIWYELQTYPDYGLAALRASTNVTDATVAFETDFEGCGACDQATRVSYAEDVLKAYGATSVESDAGKDGATHDAAVDGESSDAAGKSVDSGITSDGSLGRAGEPATTVPDDSAGGCTVAHRPGEEGPSYSIAAMLFVAIGAARRRGNVRRRREFGSLSCRGGR